MARISRPAMRSARAAMKDLQHLLAEGGSKDFYTQLFKIFNDYLEKKINMPPGKADLESVETALGSTRVDKKKIAYLKELYELAERARFASASVRLEDMKRSFLDMEEVMDEIERRVK